MSSIVTLQDGQQIRTDEEPQALADRFDLARQDGTLIRVDTDDDSVWINPHLLATISLEGALSVLREETVCPGSRRPQGS